MFARLLKMHIQENKTGEAAKLFEENVIPLCRDKNGYLGAFFLSDKNTNTCLPITLWESEKDMMETEESRFFQEQIVKFMGLFSEPPIREAYEVILKD